MGKIKNNINFMVGSALIASVYAVLCIMLGNLSYLGIQIRLATLIEPIPFYLCKTKEQRNMSKMGIYLGVVIANLFSPLGILDVVFGIVEEYLLLGLLYNVCYGSRIKQTMGYTVINAVLVSLELYLVYSIPFLYSVVSVGIPAFVLYYLGTKNMEIVSNQLNKVI